MSGHSKWAQIKHKKAAADAKRGDLFGKLSRAVSLAAREGSDPAANSRLRFAIARAREFNLPRENIDRAIKKAVDAEEGGGLSEVAYEAYGPGGSALLIEGVTDNKNRATAEIKHILLEHGGKLAEAGSVDRLFEKRGGILLARDKNPELAEEAAELEIIDAGAEEIVREPEGVTVLTAPNRRDETERTLRARGFLIENAEDAMIPKNVLELGGKEKTALARLIETLENHADVHQVWTNAAMN